MFKKLLLKRLSFDDLTLFKNHSPVNSVAQTKGIELPQAILTDEFYPSLPIILENKYNEIMMTVNIYGPGLGSQYTIQRKLQKRGFKNYHLKGELITDPEEEPARFHSLQPGDFVTFDFLGDIEPSSAKAVFIAQKLPDDALLHKLLDSRIGSKSMILLQPEELESLVSNAQLAERHPANLLISEASLEDAAFGGIEGVKALRTGPYKGKVSRQDLEQARKNAQRSGRLGEEFIFSYLEMAKYSGFINDFEWEADENAIAPFDFLIRELNGTTTLIDVKSTKGSFSNRIHISYNELLQMQVTSQYDLYRVFEIAENTAKLRIAKNLSEFADKIVEIMQQLPSGVQSNSISVSPTELSFGEVQEISFHDEDFEE